jgi:hypothetical protein
MTRIAKSARRRAKLGSERTERMVLRGGMGYVDGMDLYEAMADNPINGSDPIRIPFARRFPSPIPTGCFCPWSSRPRVAAPKPPRDTTGTRTALRCGTSGWRKAFSNSPQLLGSEVAEGPNPASAPSGSAPGISSPSSVAWPWREIIQEKLDLGLQAQRIYQDLLEHGYGGSYYSVRRLVKKLTAWTDPPVRANHSSAAHTPIMK